DHEGLPIIRRNPGLDPVRTIVAAPNRANIQGLDRGFVLEGSRLDTSPPTTFVLNGVTADLSSETLRDHDNRTIALRHQTFAVLRHLLEHPDRGAPKDELMRIVWNGIAVTDDSLVQCVHEIRAALN